MFEFVDDLTNDDLDEWILNMGASVTYMGAWAVTLAMIPCEGHQVSGVDKADVIYENSTIECVG